MISYSIRTASLYLLLCCAWVTTFAQDSSVSPYSGFGIGDVRRPGFISQQGMASTGVAVVEPVQINPINPAAPAYLSGPGFQFGVISEHGNFSTTEESANNSLTRFDHFAVGFPLKKGQWGVSFGMYPYTTIGYSSSATSIVQDSITQITEYQGEGGLNRMFLDLAKRIVLMEDTSKFAQNTELGIGGEMGYLFGNIRDIRNTVFPNDPGFFNARLSNVTNVSDVGWGGGLMFRTYLKQKVVDGGEQVVLNIGGKWEGGGRFSAQRSQDFFTYVQNASGIESPRDSVSAFNDRKGRIIIPSTVRLGTSLEYSYKQREGSSRRRWVWAVDYTLTPWSTLEEDFGAPVQYSGVGDAQSLSFGMLYQTDADYRRGSRGNIFNMATYRMGAFLGDSYIATEGQILSESGMSLGMSLPLLVGGLRRSETHLDLSAGYARRGSTDNNLIQEDYWRFMIGFSFHPERFDRWFQKRKYD